MKLINLKNLKTELANRSDIDTKEKIEIYRCKEKQNCRAIGSILSNHYAVDVDISTRALMVKGSDRDSSPITAKINNSLFFLCDGLTLKMSSLFITIYLKNTEIFRIDIEDITQFDIYGGVAYGVI